MYKSGQVKELLGVRDSILSRLRKQLIKGDDWIKNENGCFYTDSGLQKLSLALRDRDVDLLHFVRRVEAETKLDRIKGNSKNIINAQVEFLMSKGYSVYEIAKRLGQKEETLLVYKSGLEEDYVYNLIKKDIYKIGEKIWQGI